jgi:hypothetical protein
MKVNILKQRRFYYYDNMSLGEFSGVLRVLVDVEFVPRMIWCCCSSCAFRWSVDMRCLDFNIFLHTSYTCDLVLL